MSEYTTPVRNRDFVLPLLLFDTNNDAVQNPTISAGDFKVYTDDVDMGNLDTLPIVSPAGEYRVKVALSEAEMDGEVVLVRWHDPGGTWEDGYAVFFPTTNPLYDLGTPASIWEYPDRRTTIPGATFNSITTGDVIVVKRGDFWSIDITGAGSLVGRTGEKLTYTVKVSRDDLDIAALVDIGEVTGMIRANGEEPGDPTDGSLTVLDENDGDIRVTVKASVTSILDPGAYCYDIQVIRSTGPETLCDGTFNIVADVKRAIT